MAAPKSRSLRRKDETILESISADSTPKGPLLRAMPSTLQSLGALGYSADEINELVVPRRTLARRTAQNQPLSVEETDKAMRLMRVARHAAKVFGDAEKANRWLRKPKDRLDGETPIVFLHSETGARAVEEMLFQIEHGFFA